jgi:hypothetical protein
LDFYHASEPIWELGRALYGEDHAKEWVESRLHELRHGQQEVFLTKITQLKSRSGEAGKTVKEQKGYFANQAERLNYQGDCQTRLAHWKRRGRVGM